jgi:long-chain acyl-CoA synthetase
MLKDTLVIPELFLKTAQEFRDSVALQYKKSGEWHRMTYAELKRQALQVAQFLLREGIQKEDRIALILENCPQWPVIYMGIVCAGGVCVPLDPQLSSEECERFLNDSDAKFVFCSVPVFSDKIKPFAASSQIRAVVVDGDDASREEYIRFSSLREIFPDRSLLPVIEENDGASLVYTSGTTAQPKGVWLTHKNLCSNYQGIAGLKVCFSKDTVLSILPLYHTYAFMGTLLVPLLLGSRITYCPSLKSADILQSIKETKVTIVIGVPQLFAPIHQAITAKLKKIPAFCRPFFLPFLKKKIKEGLGKNIRLFVSGGARLEPQVASDFAHWGFTLIEGYGLTETSPIVSLNLPGKVKFGSVGKPLPGVEVTIHNPDVQGVGEVIIRGPNVMAGYYHQPELTAEAIWEGWFHSGDIGYLDRDGYLFLLGREKEIIVLRSGKNISPQELEEYYGKSPFIREMCVLTKSEEKFGQPVESLYAVVVPDLDFFRKKNIGDIRSTIRWELENLGKGLPAYKHILGFSLVKEDLSRTALRKIKRYEVRERMLAADFKEVESKEAALSSFGGITSPVTQKVLQYLMQQTHKPVAIDSHLEIDLGIDSLSRLELVLGLENIFHIKIPDEAMAQLQTVVDVCSVITAIQRQEKVVAGGQADPPLDWGHLLKEIPMRHSLEKKIRVHPGVLDRCIAYFFRCLFQFVFRTGWLLRVKGREHIPARGPYLLSPNHASFLDAFVVFSVMPFWQASEIFFIGYSEIMNHPFVRWATPIARLIAIDSSRHLSEAMQAASWVVKQNKIVCIFPEGNRSIDENVGIFKKGVGILVKELGIPVVPVYIKGSHYSWPRTKRFPRFCPLEVIFAKPLSAAELLARGDQSGGRDAYSVIANALREEVVKLS